MQGKSGIILCGGVFFTLLVEASKERISKRDGRKGKKGDVKDEYIIPIKVGREEALKGCPIEVSTALIQQRKMPKVPKISLEDDVVIYRPFYIVECLNEDNENFHILFDAVTGDFSLLDS